MSVRRRTLIAAAAVVLFFLPAGLVVAFAEHRLVQLAAAAAGLGAAVGLAAEPVATDVVQFSRR